MGEHHDDTGEHRVQHRQLLEVLRRLQQPAAAPSEELQGLQLQA